MNRIGIISNLRRDKNLETTQGVIKYLLENGCIPYVDKRVYSALKNNEGAVRYEDVFSETEMLIVLGGDGTMLQAARYACVHNKPLLGINLGNLGYLTDVEKYEAHTAIKRIMESNYKIEKRMMLEVSINFEGKRIVNDEWLALNDVCVSRGAFSKMAETKVIINKTEYIATYSGDGIIVSTPTGSTAYNFSAGGPLLKPDSEMIAVTPICAHTPFARPSVVPSSDEITIEHRSGEGDKSILAMDGQTIRTLTQNESVVVKKSKYYTSIIKTNEIGFYDIFRSKMTGMRKSGED